MPSRRRSLVRSYRRKSVFLPYFSLLVILTVLLGIFITTYLVINPKEVRESQAGVSTPKLYVGLANSTGEVKRYDTTTKKWISLGNQAHTGVTAVVQFANKLYFGFNDGWIKAYNPNGSPAWTDLGDKGTRISSMAVYNGKLYIGQADAPGAGTVLVRSYNGSTWSTLRTDVNIHAVNVMEVYNGKLFVGYTGSINGTGGFSGCYQFYNSTSTNSWSSEYCSLPNGFRTMEVHTDPLSTKLWMGDMTVQGNMRTTSTGTNVLVQPALGQGVRALLSYKNNLYAAGGTGTVFRWNNSTAKWVSLGDQGSQIDNMITGYGGLMFTGDSSGVVKQFNGSTWSTIGSWTVIGTMILFQP